MPKRNKVPSLKLLAIRQIAWPDYLRRGKNEPFPSTIGRMITSQNVCTLIYGQNMSEKRKFLDKEIDSIVNAWIRLSDFYQTRLDEMRQISYFLSFHSISTLDFLHQGFVLRSGDDISTFAGVIPSTASPQPVNPYTWKEITSLVKKSGNSTMMRGLYIMFGHSLTSDNSAYHFMKTFPSFPRLTKLVVTGVADDHFMHGVGVCCHFLRHLDIRGTKVTEKGVIRLLLKSPLDVNKFKTPTQHVLPMSCLHPLCYTLEYFDMSTVPKEEQLLTNDSVVTTTCTKLIGTHGRFFFYPGGSARFKVEIEELDMANLRNKIMTGLRSRLVDSVFEFVVILRTNLQFPCSDLEVRVDDNGEESSILYFQGVLLAVEMKVDHLTIIRITSYTASTCDFLPLRDLAKYTPHLKEIKASLKGTLTQELKLRKLHRVTAPNIHSKETLIGIILHCDKIEYIEVRALFMTGTNGFNDDDLSQMMANGPYHRLEAFRLLFDNHITLFPGVKQLAANCPNLRVIGDFYYWVQISTEKLNRFIQNMSAHNFDIMIEFAGLLHHTNTPCKEFFR